MLARTSMIRAAVAGAVLALAAAPAGAQAFAYPSFQTPRVAQREFNFGVADADGATSLLFQWREGSGSRNQLSLDVGFADTDLDGAFFLGGQFGRQLTTSNASMPFDLMLTVGANVARVDFGPDSRSVLRIPVGVSAGLGGAGQIELMLGHCGHSRQKPPPSEGKGNAARCVL